MSEVIKKNAKICCVYFITCLTNKKQYVGSTIDFESRTLDHLKCLRSNRHCNKKLQRAYNKYGEESFQFSIYEECIENQLLKLEQNVLDNLGLVKNGFNIAEFTSSGFRGRTWSEEDKERQRKRMAGRYVGENNPFYGKKHSLETISKLRTSRLGKYNGEKNPFFGKKHSPESIKKILDSRSDISGDKNPNFGHKWNDDQRNNLSRKRKIANYINGKIFIIEDLDSGKKLKINHIKKWCLLIKFSHYHVLEYLNTYGFFKQYKLIEKSEQGKILKDTPIFEYID